MFRRTRLRIGRSRSGLASGARPRSSAPFRRWSLSSWKILSVAAFCLLQDRLPYEGSIPPVAVIPRLDVTAVLRTWRIKGALWCPWRGHTKPCLWVENAYPCGLLEVVRQPFKSHLFEMPFPMKLTTSGHIQHNLLFAESCVFTFVPPLLQYLEIPIAAPRSKFMINYLSELDAVGWRTGLLDSLFTFNRECAGNWGCYYPRRGFVEQPSEVIAAHLQALRGGRVASLPFGRVVLMPYDFEPRTGHYIQMISPVIRPAVSIGYPDLQALEAGNLSKYGAYLFVQWGLFDECRNCMDPRYLPSRAPGR